MARTPKPPQVWFSFRSPFSWIAMHELHRRVPTARETFEFKPFWEPDANTAARLAARGGEIIYAPMSKAKHLYILQDTKRLAERYGLSMTWPVDMSPWWEPSHLAWLLAERAGLQWEFYDAVVAARWERGEDISDPTVVAHAAETAGLDPAAVRSAVDDQSIRDAGADALYQAYHGDIFGVPYFVNRRKRFWGIDRLEWFLTDLSVAGVEVSNEEPPSVDEHVERLLTAAAYDTDSAGGCG
ncbi:2-hydroxychromene-2-carboxylate isomerase [Rhodococcus sp. 1168]|uniref:2-hydroxychromene-2-carboxylate isomerase n=1 Tax=Rhodococcus sp. 1168 TaxID=2018041 RepID=UPI000A0A6CD5|nr:DsbA family protein [Rhodococcus sp. 1168]ORI21287.1 hypothetical protein BJI47_17630 [Rhodococcus sp. 1168]